MLLYLSKAFDCIIHDLLIAKLDAFGFEKFQAVLVPKRKNTIPEDLTICVKDADAKPKNSVKFLEITLNNKLNFENDISFICKSVICQLHALFSI